MYPLIALTLCSMTLVHLWSISHFPMRSAVLICVHFLGVHFFFAYHSVASLTSAAAPHEVLSKCLLSAKPNLFSEVLRWETTTVLRLLTSICRNLPLPYCFRLLIEHSLVCFTSFLYTTTHIL